MTLPLSQIAAMTPQERLRAAYSRCAELARRISFDRALADPTVKHCLALTAESMQRREETARDRMIRRTERSGVGLPQPTHNNNRSRG